MGQLARPGAHPGPDLRRDPPHLGVARHVRPHSLYAPTAQMGSDPNATPGAQSGSDPDGVGPHGVRPQSSVTHPFRTWSSSSSASGAYNPNQAALFTHQDSVNALTPHEAPQAAAAAGDPSPFHPRSARLGRDHDGPGAAIVRPGLSANLATDLARYGTRRAVAGRVLPQRENRVHRQPDRRDRRRAGAAGGRPAADVAPGRADGRLDPHHRARGPRLQAPVLRVLARPRDRRDDRSRPGGRDDASPVGDLAERHAQRSPRDRRAAGAAR